jgi:hypothetical protein
MDPSRLVSDIGFAYSVVERRMAALMGKQTSGRLKNPPTIMTCTRCPVQQDKYVDRWGEMN